MAADVDIEPDEIVALLAVPPDEFVAARTARVKELKAAGSRDAAAALATLRKPVRLVWIVGELARRHPDVAAAAAGVAAQLEEAQAGGSGVRPLLKQFRDVVGQVADLADEIEGVVDRLEVGLALREVLADPGGREAWLAGRLLALPGDEDDGAPPDELAPRRAEKAAAEKAATEKAATEKAARMTTEGDGAAATAEAERVAREEAERAARAEARRVAQEAVEVTDAEVADADASLARAQEALESLQARVSDARSVVAGAKKDLAGAKARHTRAEKARARLDD